MRIAVIGAKGMLGFDLCASLKGSDFVPLDIDELDITSIDACRRVLKKVCPKIIINLSAYTQVDRAEDEQEKAHSVNALGPKNLAISCAEMGCAICQISTDYVFDGAKTGPYIETDTPNPLSVYGTTKLEGEKNVISTCKNSWIIRTAWLYGINGKNFVKAITSRALQGLPLKVVADQIGSPTFTQDLSKRIMEIVNSAPYGIYHATNSGVCSWYDFAIKILQEFDIKSNVEPIKSSEWPCKATRPKNSVLENRTCAQIGWKAMPPWEDGLKRYARLQAKTN